MSDKVIVSKQDANDLPFVEQEHSGDRYVLLEDVKHWLDQATPVSGEAVAMINFNEHEEYICMPVGREVFKLAPDVDHLLYTTPQPADTVPREQYDRAIKALRDAKNTIKTWHGDVAWDIYDKASPEMKRLNQALAEAKGE